MVTLRQLQFAIAVARHKHFKRAAEDCKISQSALSLGISELEKVLGIAIFERNNKQVVLTPIGEEIIRRAEKIYLDAQQLVERAYALQEELSYPITIGFIPTIAPYLLPYALPVLSEKYPKFLMNIVENTSSRLVSMVQSGDLDAAVLALPFDINGLESIEFATENFWVIAHKDNQIFQDNCEEGEKCRITPAKIKKFPPMLLGEGHCLRDHIAEICKIDMNDKRNIFRDSSLNTLIQLTINNMGYTLIPQMALPQMLGYSQLRCLQLEAMGPHRRIAIVYRPAYPRVKELKLVAEMFATALHKQRFFLWENAEHLSIKKEI